MSRNIGKVFEEQFSKSIPNYALLYRLKDPAQSFGNNNNLRFSAKNPFDFIMWDSRRHNLFALEIKTISGNSISFERCKEDKGVIHYHQILGLNKWNQYDGIICGIIIEFRSMNRTIFIHINDFNKLVGLIQKKSFSMLDIEKNNIPFLIIQQKLARTKFTYDVDTFLSTY